MSIDITYNGNKIAALEGGKTAVIKCAGKKMKSDLTVTAPEGGGGECSGNHIIEVDELPTENIDETAVYWDGESYHKYGAELKDIISVSNGTASSFVEQYTAYGITFELYYVKARPTENIIVSGEIFACYYVEDEADILMYGDFAGSGTNEWGSLAELLNMSNQGAITDISEATVEGGCYALIDEGWTNYIVPKGSITITENGEYDVFDLGKANVDILSDVVYGAWDIYNFRSPSNYLSVSVNFTTMWNGKVTKCVGFYYTAGMSVKLTYRLEDGGGIEVYNTGSWYGGDWLEENSEYTYKYTARYINFGEEPQMVSSDLVSFLENCTPIYEMLNEVQTATLMDMLLETTEVGTVIKYVGGSTDSYTNGFLYTVAEIEEDGSKAYRKLIPDGGLPVWNGTDLTGTTWRLVSGWTYPTSNNTLSLNGLCIISYDNYDERYNFYEIKIGGAYMTVVSSGVNAVLGNSKDLTFKFTGGTDATNATLIDFFKQYGQLTSHTMPTT